MKHAKTNQDSFCWNLSIPLDCEMRAVVDPKLTGKRLRDLLQQNRISVSMLQDALQLSCPQSIYHWFWGKALPSIEHLVTMSRMLCVPVEGLLVFRPKTCIAWPQQWKYREEDLYRRVMAYGNRIAA